MNGKQGREHMPRTGWIASCDRRPPWTRTRPLALAAALAVLASVSNSRNLSQGGSSTLRASTNGTGAQADGASHYAALSADGRYVAFASEASNLAGSDVNELEDVYWKDLVTGATVRISRGLAGTDTDGDSTSASISADGMRVAFTSEASNLVLNDANHLPDVFVHDLASQGTTRVSLPVGGGEANGGSSSPRLSADGRFVAFASRASNLVAGDTNAQPDVFVRDLSSGMMELASVGAGGEPATGASEGPSLSVDGRYVAFSSTSSNLIAGETCADAQTWNVYVRDRANGTTVRASPSLTGGRGDGHSFAAAISADGRLVAFASAARDLVVSDLNGRLDVFVRDLVAGTTTRVSRGPGGQEAGNDSTLPALSGDGRYVAFQSRAPNLVPQPAPDGVTLVYLHDRSSGTTTRIVAASWVSGAVGGASNASLSADGRWLAFSSSETSLVAGDGNEADDVFLRGPLE